MMMKDNDVSIAVPEYVGRLALAQERNPEFFRGPPTRATIKHDNRCPALRGQTRGLLCSCDPDIEIWRAECAEQLLKGGRRFLVMHDGSLVSVAS